MEAPGIRGHGTNTESFVYVSKLVTYGFDLQKYFDGEHNTFGALSSRKANNPPTPVAMEPCGQNLVLAGRREGCEGRRKKRKVIVRPPHILNVSVPEVDGRNLVNKPSDINHELIINEVRYKFVGALLYNGNGTFGHYRSVYFLGGKFAQYDGMFSGAYKMKWHAENNCFGAGWGAAKLWYVPIVNGNGIDIHAGIGASTFDSIESIGVPNGLSFILKPNIAQAVDDNCNECNTKVQPATPCLVARDKKSETTNFHIHCCSGLKDKASEIFEAVDNCSFWPAGKVELRKMLLDQFGTNASASASAGESASASASASANMNASTKASTNTNACASVRDRVSKIDVEGILRASLEGKGTGVGRQWLNSLPPEQQRVIKNGVDALIYAGSMSAAKKVFDGIVQTNMGSDLLKDQYYSIQLV